jgi:UDP-3-O-[3-hydroxymyristoyl] N-acetylglucosamine deacetylase/3-hydroxyacyl-[acyl-carrier-protein] dehydratase
MNTKQHTLKESFSLKGKGLHTGLDIEIRFNPAPVGHGYKIKRIDLEDRPVIDALAENVKGTQRGTILSKDEVSVSTVEHAMAALYACQVDNCLIEVNAPEFPILDGSAIVYVDEIEQVGLAEQNAVREYYVVKHKIEVSDSETGSSIIVLPDDSFGIDVHITFDSVFLDNQYATLNDLKDFKKKIAASRTFVFVRELEPLLQHGLIKGGDLDNAIVIYEHQISQEHFDRLADTMNVKHRDASKLGYIMNKPLVYNNEPARHKLLDVLGDIALIGRPLIGRIIAGCPGHKINNQFARFVRKDIKINDIQCPVYNPNIPPVMDIARIKELLPHRFPFLLVDKVIELGAMHIVGIKNVTVNEPFFQGHFPEEPVMPGVLIVEAMAQAAGLLVLNGLDEPHRYSTYFMKIDNVKFRRKVVPGDTIIFKVELASEFRRGTAIMKGYTFVGEKLTCEVEFMAQIIKNK